MQKPATPAIPLIIAVILLVFTSSYADQALTRTFDYPRHGFSISLPDDWDQMPREKLDGFNQLAQVQHPDWKRPAMHYGYQTTNTAKLAFTPVLLIRVSDTPSNSKAILEEMEKESPPKGLERKGPVFDAELNACLLQWQGEFSGYSVETYAVYFPTKNGVLKMFFYIPRSNEQNPGNLVRQILKKVSISEELKTTPAAPASRLGLILGLLAIGVVVLVLSRAKPAKSP